MGSWALADIPNQSGRVALVTGANSGLGLRSAQALAKAGARVLLACRDQNRAAEAVALVAQTAKGPAPESVALDLADLDSVRACAKEVAQRVGHIDMLLNNAGVMGIPLRHTEQGFEAQFGTNHLGHFALDGLLLPLLLAAPEARVVTTTSLMHRLGSMQWDDLHGERRYRKWLAYGQSKLANLLFAFELDRLAHAHESRLISVAAHPGYAATHLQAVGPEMTGDRLSARLMRVSNKVIAQSAVMGALPQLYAATAPEVAGGEFYGPGGLMEMRGSPRRTRPRHAAQNANDAQRLWQISEQTTGIAYPW